MKRIREYLILVMLMSMCVVVSGQKVFDGDKVGSSVNFHVKSIPVDGVINRSLMYMDARKDMFPGFESTWMFKFESPNEGKNVLMPSYYSGMDIGSCVVGEEVNIFFYPNPFFNEHYIKLNYRATLKDAEMSSDGSIFYKFKTSDDDIFIIEAYPESWLYKLVLPMKDGFMIYQIVTHKNKLR